MAKVKKYKLKTKSSAKKRFKVTGKGKIVFRRAERSHGNTKRSAKQVRQAKKNGVMCAADAKLVHRMLCNN